MGLFNLFKHTNKLDVKKTSKTDDTVAIDANSVRSSVFKDMKVTIYNTEKQEDDADYKNYDYVGYIKKEQKSVPVVTATVNQIDDDLYELNNLAVIKKYRKHGYAKELLKKIEKELKKEDAFSLCVEVPENVVKFYRDQGYDPYGQPMLKDNVWYRKMSKDF